MNTPHTFVLVPSYNHARFVGDCLRSIIEQTVPPNKLLVIDDGSEDGSPRIIEKILNDCPFPAELVVRGNRGLTRTLNEGFAKSSGRYFAYLGSDDYWFPEFLENRQRVLAESPDAAVVYGNSYIVDEDGAVKDCTENWELYSGGEIRPLLYAGCAPISSSVVYRRSAIESFSWDEDIQLEDYDCYLRILVRCVFAFDPKALSAWRQHASNTSSDSEMLMRECLTAQTKNLRMLIDADEFREIQNSTKLQHLEVFLRKGKKREALRHMWQDEALFLSVLRSKRHVAKLIFPHALVDLNQRIIKYRSARKYGRH